MNNFKIFAHYLFINKYSMNKLIVLFLGILIHTSDPVWLNDFSKAQSEARQSNKFILLNFSGSDWCTPCIHMHKTIFESAVFEGYSTKNLVLLNADFPRLSKHKLSKDQQQKNDELAEQFNPSGKFPLTLLLDAQGKVVHSWEGFPNESAEKFVEEINSAINASK
jgi:thioredoxin-related protein